MSGCSFLFSRYILALNKTTIVQAGALQPLIILLGTESAEVQCNACGCITTLATTGGWGGVAVALSSKENVRDMYMYMYIATYYQAQGPCLADGMYIDAKVRQGAGGLGSEPRLGLKCLSLILSKMSACAFGMTPKEGGVSLISITDHLHSASYRLHVPYPYTIPNTPYSIPNISPIPPIQKGTRGR